MASPLLADLRASWKANASDEAFGAPAVDAVVAAIVAAVATGPTVAASAGVWCCRWNEGLSIAGKRAILVPSCPTATEEAEPQPGDPGFDPPVDPLPP